MSNASLFLCLDEKAALNERGVLIALKLEHSNRNSIRLIYTFYIAKILEKS